MKALEELEGSSGRWIWLKYFAYIYKASKIKIILKFAYIYIHINI